MQIVMNDTNKMEAEAYKARRCIFELQGKCVVASVPKNNKKRWNVLNIRKDGADNVCR